MLETNQIVTTGPVGLPATPSVPEPQASSTSPTAAPPDSQQVADPKGTDPSFERRMENEAAAKGEEAPGVEAENAIWEARYSMKNFIGRLTVRIVLTLGWIALLIYTLWSENTSSIAPLTIVLGIALGIVWVALLYRIIRARYGHFYRLTNRRLFVSTGLLRRRCDQMELLHVKDVFIRQTLLERWLSLGTVVVVSKEAELPTFYLAGVNDPEKVMDLVWHCARSEREGTAVQIDNV